MCHAYQTNALAEKRLFAPAVGLLPTRLTKKRAAGQTKAFNTAQPHAKLPTLSVLPGPLAQLLVAFAVNALAARVHVVHLPGVLPHTLREWARLRLRPRLAFTPARPCFCIWGL